MPAHWHFWIQLFKMAERGGKEGVINLDSFCNHRGKGEYWSVCISETLFVKLCLQTAGFMDTTLARVFLVGACSWSVLPCQTLLCYTYFTAAHRKFSSFMLTCKIFGSSFSCCAALRHTTNFLKRPCRGISADRRSSRREAGSAFISSEGRTCWYLCL